MGKIKEKIKGKERKVELKRMHHSAHTHTLFTVIQVKLCSTEIYLNENEQQRQQQQIHVETEEMKSDRDDHDDSIFILYPI